MGESIIMHALGTPRPLRRQYKAIQDRDQLEKILREATICRLGMAVKGLPYVVPLSYGYQAGVLYFHAASMGMKVEMMRENPRVCFEIDQINEPIPGENPCNWTMRYESIIGFGTVEFIEERQAKEEAMNLIYAHYAGTKATQFNDRQLANVVMLRLPIESMTGKRSG